MASASGHAFLFFAGHYMSSGALHHATETFTASVLHSNLRKLCRVFKTKERFTALVDGRRHPALFEIVRARVPELLERMLAARGGDDASAEAMRSLRSWSETMLALREKREDASLEPTFTLRTLVNAIVHSSEHSILRTEAVLTAQVVGAACPSMRAPLVSAIVESATDEEALAPAWQLGVLDDPRCLERVSAATAAPLLATRQAYAETRAGAADDPHPGRPAPQHAVHAAQRRAVRVAAPAVAPP